MRVKYSRLISAVLAYAFIIIAIANGASSSSSLKQVQIIFRHGNRTPKHTNLAFGEAQLTDEGKEEILRTAKYYREQYGEFLSLETGKSRNDVSFVSSDLDRTLESAGVFVYGLYENLNEKPSWNGGQFKYEPFPIRSIPTEVDRFLQFTESCPRYNDELMPESCDICYPEFARNNPELVEAFMDITGSRLLGDPNVDNFTKFDAVDVLAEQIRFNKTHNLPLSEIGRRMNEFPEIFTLGNLCLFHLMSPHESKRLNGGPLLQVIIGNFHKEIGPKLIGFSAHDKTLYSQLMILGHAPPQIPPTASSLVYELHESELHGNTPYLKIYYREGSQDRMKELKFEGCGEPCNLNIFAKIAQPFIPIDFQDECRIKN